MTYQINTVEELQALPFGAMVETAEGKHTKTSDADEWDFMHDSAEILAEGNVVAFTTGSGVAKPKPKPEEPAQSLSVTGDSKPEETGDEAVDAMAAFKAALGDATKKVGAKPSQFDDEPHEHGGGLEVGWIISIIDMNLSVVPVASWAMPTEDLAKTLAGVLNDVLNKVSTKTFFVGASPVLGFHTIPMIDLGDAAAIDLGYIVQALVGEEEGVEERIKAVMEEQAERTKEVKEIIERKLADKLGDAPQTQPTQVTDSKNWMAWGASSQPESE